MSKIVMVSGHTNLTKEEFNKYSFVVGGASGCDEMTQKYLSNKGVPLQTTLIAE